MYAIIEDSGKQFKVTSGDRIRIDRPIDQEITSVTFDRVLMVGGEGEPRIGLPFVEGATVSTEVVGPVKGEKVYSVKYRRRKGFHKKIGHRQKYIEVRITGINV
jgi:large subunit ribosomal protein L21